MTIKLIALFAVLATAGCCAALAWRKRQQQRLLNSRETAHRLRQAEYLQQLAQTTLHCDLDPHIARVLLQLAEESLVSIAAAGQLEACQATALIRLRVQSLDAGGERSSTSADIAGEVQPQREAEPDAGCDGADDASAQESAALWPTAPEPDYARVRLQLTDAARLLHRAVRKSLIDRSQQQRMTHQLQKARLHADTEHLLLREQEALASGDLARARSCLSQARSRLDGLDPTPQVRALAAKVDRRFGELDINVQTAPDDSRQRSSGTASTGQNKDQLAGRRGSAGAADT